MSGVSARDRRHAHGAGATGSRSEGDIPAITVWLSRNDLAALMAGHVSHELRATFGEHLAVLRETPADTIERWHVLGELARAR